MSVHVFLGPTLPHADARRILEAHYLPPVAMGDVVRLLEQGPTVIAIIDGLFEQTPAVWHKEILFALSHGVRVMGAASMGALRAAELHTFGMEGVGAVFEAFRDGVLEDDDEVAVAHLPASDGFRPVSDAMVNIRLGLRQASEVALVSAETAETLARLAKDLYYPERTWRTVIGAGRAAGLPPAELTALEDFVAQTRPDAKRADAIRLLTELAAAQSTKPTADFDFEPTYHWELMRASELGSEGLRALGEALASPAGPAELARHLRLRHGGDEAFMAEALLLWLLTREVTREPSLVDDQAVRTRAETLEQRGFSSRLAASLAPLEIAAQALVARQRRHVESFMPTILARRGEWQTVLDDLALTRRALAARGLERPSLEDAGVSEEALLAWYEKKFGRPAAGLDDHARSGGFESGEELLEELLRHFLVDRG